LDLLIELIGLYVLDNLLALLLELGLLLLCLLLLVPKLILLPINLIVECSVLDPSFLFIVDDLLQTQVCDCFFILLDLLLVFEVQKSILRNDDLTIHIDPIVLLLHMLLKL